MEAQKINLTADRFIIEVATIQDIQNALDSRQITSQELVKMYLDRIQAIDKDGPHSRFLFYQISSFCGFYKKVGAIHGNNESNDCNS